MSRYKMNSFSKADKIIHNLSDGITHADPELNKKLMNARYNKEGCFYLRIDIKDFNCKSEIVGDAAIGFAALAELIAETLKSEDRLEAFFKLIKTYMKAGD